MSDLVRNPKDCFSHDTAHIFTGHHTKKSEKQFASSPGRKSATLPLMYEDETESTYTDASYYTELQQDAAPQPAITPTKAGSKKKRKTAKATKSPVEIKPRPRRSAAAMKSPLKSDIYVGENEDIEDLSEDEQEHSESGAEIETKTDQENNAVEYTEIVPVSDPVPVLPKVDTEDLLLAQQYSGDSAEFSGAHGEHLNMENISVKKEAGFEIETGGISDEEDPEWEPGTKKRRKSSGSRSVTSPVNVSRSQAESE